MNVQVRACDGLLAPYRAEHHQTSPDTTKIGPDRVLAGQGPIWLVWQVKDSNRERHQPTDLQKSARDVLTSNYSPSA
jgi:hypothetical protein